LGKSLGELNFERTYGAVVTRVTRADVEFAANNQVRLQFGDFLFVVGSNEGVVQVGDLVGNKPKALDQPHVLPVFVGILLGVILGSLPIVLPGTPAPVRLGLAGGPSLLPLVLSRVGRIGPLIWYLSPSANLVPCRRNNMPFAVGQLAVFQGASEAPISEPIGRASNAEKRPTGHGPVGCD
jgi:putative transport protein